ncbi:hypothetical protein D0869_01196 [Hortaea werneckii]|uniref:AB hydrolase-1 domain-containing protein n=1 Tax=Hortaea werneckii TaxID=91943 RepID=A0A3M6XET0_HORWE|nr:hypothetical protein D0869_01196 [Hortaea werneckii]RMY15457.1 hypothetical protein D0868_00882 [Hortaea werneckii]
MPSLVPFLAITGSLIKAGFSLPTTTSTSDSGLDERGLVDGITGTADDFVGDLTDGDLIGVVGDALDSLQDIGQDASSVGGLGGVVSQLTSIRPTATPSSQEQAMSQVSAVFQASPTPNNIFAAAGRLVADGLTGDDAESLLDFIEGGLTGENSENNDNPRNPPNSIYPKAQQDDAPYDLSEDELRGVIYIPPNFQYGREGAPQPVILVPGTGDTGFTTFQGNLIPLLQGSTVGDPVWLNIPGYLLNDIQTNAEYVAYAINYISGISNGRNVAVAGWSQGNICTQWAFKYWPSTIEKVTDHVAFSPDYHGTVIADFISLGEPLPPSLLQQQYNSQFIQTLRRDGGDSAYVPTTTIYSGFFDEIVQPQSGTEASAFLLDARNVGASNNEVQKVCAGQLAGSFFTHEGTLYNSLGYYLFIDALTHDGPGDPQRLNLETVCSYYLTPGLDLGDFLVTENSLLVAALSIGTYPNPVVDEPRIKSKFAPLRYLHAK